MNDERFIAMRSSDGAEATSSRRHRLLLIDGNHALCARLKMSLAEHGIEVVTETDGAAGLTRFKLERADIVMLDIVLPNKDGYQLCREMRAASDVPILVHTARSNDIDHVLALEFGADDFVVKPIDPRVLMARIMALMRRVRIEPTPPQNPRRIGDLVVNRLSRMVTFRGRPVDLTSTEFDLLWLLFNNCGEVVTRDEIMRTIDKRPFSGVGRAIDGRVFRLRKKLVDVGAKGDVIRSARSTGYVMVEAELTGSLVERIAA
jgi:two-component system, OmpR family, response regulator RstA